ncbi:MAG: hypothetical protein ACI8W3_003386 [Myxococcota bacterium]|jgi:hypothetical protein
MMYRFWVILLIAASVGVPSALALAQDAITEACVYRYSDPGQEPDGEYSGRCQAGLRTAMGRSSTGAGACPKECSFEDLRTATGRALVLTVGTTWEGGVMA